MDQKKARAIADRCHKVNTHSEFNRSSHSSLSFLGIVLYQQSYKMTRHFPPFLSSRRPLLHDPIYPTSATLSTFCSARSIPVILQPPKTFYLLTKPRIPIGPICSKLRRLTIDSSREV
ncbi:hypothetical protein G6F37_011684 [Rhizopus arrhizus]|nr:hypothetical protein G6F38_008263 [Rhizopus arrhizus]KAG1148006.1 hypothetical protein G6F37_011684 [Rhizopus arrhizus]